MTRSPLQFGQPTNVVGGFLGGLRAGQQFQTGRLQQEALQQQISQREQLIAQEQALTQLRQEATQSPEALSRLATIRPQEAQQIQQFQTNRALLGGQAAQALKLTPMEKRPQVYQQTIRSLQQQGVDVSNLPAEYDPEVVDPLLDFYINSARDVEKQLGRTGVAAPSAVREFEFFEKLSPAEQQRFLGVKRNILQTGITLTPEGEAAPIKGIADAKAQIKAAEKEGIITGQNVGELKKQLREREASLPELEATVKRLGELGRTATYTRAGLARDVTRREAGLLPTTGAVARAEYIATIDNQILPLLRQTFGAQFTEREGQTLKQTLGDPNKSPNERQAALNAFIRQKRATIETLKRELGEIPEERQPSLEGEVGGIKWRLK